MAKVYEKLTHRHLYRLRVGESLTEKFVTMRDDEMRRANLEFVKEFSMACQRGKPNGERLQRWELQKRHVSPKEAASYKKG